MSLAPAYRYALDAGNEAHDNLIIGATTPVRLNDSMVQLTSSHNLSTGTATDHFVNAATADYHLLGTSAAIHAGIDTSARGVATDFDRNPRNVGGACDVGAYEHQ